MAASNHNDIIWPVDLRISPSLSTIRGKRTACDQQQMRSHEPDSQMGEAHDSDAPELLSLFEMPSLNAMQMLKTRCKHSEIESNRQRKIFSHMTYSR